MGASVWLGVTTSMCCHDSSGKTDAGAGLRITVVPTSRAMRNAAATASRGISMETTTTSAARMVSRKLSTASIDNSSRAPGAMTMRFSPLLSTRMNPTIVAAVPVTTWLASTPSRSHRARASAARASLPTAVSRLTLAPSRAAPMAWLEPLPPGPASYRPPETVSPPTGTWSRRIVIPTP